MKMTRHSAERRETRGNAKLGTSAVGRIPSTSKTIYRASLLLSPQKTLGDSLVHVKLPH